MEGEGSIRRDGVWLNTITFTHTHTEQLSVFRFQLRWLTTGQVRTHKLVSVPLSHTHGHITRLLVTREDSGQREGEKASFMKQVIKTETQTEKEQEIKIPEKLPVPNVQSY